MRSLGELLQLHLKRRGLDQQEFAAVVGLSGATVSRILHDKQGTSPDRADLWCSVLGLKGRDANEMTDAIHLSAATPRVRARFAMLERQLAQAQRREGVGHLRPRKH